MRKKSGSSGEGDRYLALAELLAQEVPSVYAVFADEDNFDRVLIKHRPDGTYLAVLKRVASDGSMSVCFGSGYGVTGCLLALDRAVQGNAWKADKPWGGPGT